MTNWSCILIAIEPRAKPDIVAGFAAALDECVARADISSALRQAHFLAQTAHESAGFKTTTEYAFGRAYEGRRDLGNTQPGDGVRFRGRGLIQLTGRANYRTYGAQLAVDLEGNPASAAAFPVAALTAALYWRTRKINDPADRDDIETVTRKINGGLNGLASRKTYLARAKHAIGDPRGAIQARAKEAAATAANAGKTAHGVIGAAAATQAAQAAPAPSRPDWTVLAGLGLALAILAAVLYLRRREHAALAARLNNLATESTP
ncbi:Glycoside hydrolase, family 19, catalytic [uncultured Caudovirales phage]|uniref:Glycoside hydrolase, family 19, catalytic n=1 Tax=uncultured Caudovirales phage TaxID=2100421 RepID=A0A6J5Q6G2_9CAUD|nr:Glycoside hydrolase, family 19, catalytic [uncultured Caudovirales phage]CAB4176905.1 Glycoside hydrolase, family 19, catalytic [uncultured Caudovirales phage]CAB4189873.1 Glycoside hydrolase, family 19, catalytic [uncultured Caudovirales phage]